MKGNESTGLCTSKIQAGMPVVVRGGKIYLARTPKLALTIKNKSEEKQVGVPLFESTPILIETFKTPSKETTVVTWLDRSTTAVRCSKNDNQDPEKAFLAAYFQKHSGLSKTQANKLIKSIGK